MATATTSSPNDLPSRGGSWPPFGSARASWREAGLADHFVQFYPDEPALVESVAGFIATGLRTVEGGIVIATAPHRAAIEQRLEAGGLDLATLRARRQYVPLDAAETLARIIVNGQPDEKLFAQVIGGEVRRMLSAGFRARLFGEMVTLLWAGRRQAAALRLEELWNVLAQTQRFALFCAYPATPFARGADAAGFRHICAVHHGVISGDLCGGESGPPFPPA